MHGVRHQPYHWFALAYIGILLVWHFPPNSRFLLPLFPLLLAGLATELANLRALCGMRGRRDAPQTLVADLCAVGSRRLYIAIVWNIRALVHELPLIISQHRTVLASDRRAFAWIAQHVPEGNFYAYDDPVFYLYTGHHAASLPVAPLPFYREDRESILRPFRSMPAFAREQHLDYVLFTAADFHRDLPEAERAEVRRILAGEKAFEPVYRSPLSSIFALSPRCAIPDTSRVEIITSDDVKTAPPRAHGSSNLSEIQ